VTNTGVQLHYTVVGEGPWVTLVHSLASDLTLLDAQAKMLARQFKVLRVDIRGHGKSPAPPSPYSMQDLADDVQTLFEKLSITQTAWVGVSLGGMMGLMHAIRHPGIITRLVVGDATAGYPESAHVGWRERIGFVRERGTAAIVQGTLSRWFTADFLQREPAVVAHFAGIIAATPANGFIGCAEAIIGYNVTAKLSQIGCPALIMVGEEDEATPPAMAQALASGIAGAIYAPIGSAAHQANIEQPDTFNMHLETFLVDAN
jgi:3-oxoadipate enol-lactonase